MEKTLDNTTVNQAKDQVADLKTFGRVRISPCLSIMSQMPDNFVDCVITSPPYWQLRDYGYPEQWGKESTYQEYLEHLWQFMDDVWRILKPTGTVWINLGDTYGTQGGQNRGKAYRNYAYSKNVKNIELGIKLTKGDVLQKCLLLIPHRFAIGCIERGWIVRNDIIWAKFNAMPESITDRFSKKHEYMFFMVKQEKYYFDLNGIRDKYKMNSNEQIIRNKGSENYAQKTSGPSEGKRNWWSKDGKNPGDVSDFWDIPTAPSSEKHYASFNFKLIEKPIVAGCPKEGLVLDPFCGVGTTGVRAIQLGRNFIGIDGSIEYCRIAEKNINRELSQQKLF